MANVDPPSYHNDDDDLALPAYDGPSARTESASTQRRSEPRPFPYRIKDGSGGWWAMMTVNGDARISSAIAPTILQGTNVAGSVQLALRNNESIQAIRVVIRGEVLGGTPGEGNGIPIVFLELKKTLWSSSEGDPNVPATKPSASGLKLKGDYNWPFSIELPTEITKGGKTYRLPHSFGTGKGYFSLQYVVELHIVRPKFHLGRDEKLPVIFTYFTLNQAATPSPLRTLAYQENSPLLGPDADPEGWHTKTFIITGKLFSSRKVVIQIKFSLAKPLSYTRSASIPCAISIESPDTEAVDLLSAPTAPMVYLECTTQQNSNNYRTTMEPCTQGVFWTPPGAQRGHVLGEIHLKPTLHPTTNFAAYGFRVQYTVVLFPFQTAGFKQTGELQPIKGSRQVVEICTRFAQGPKPKTYSPSPAPGTQRNSALDSYYRLKAATTLEVASEDMQS
ncbi:hypothetical protein C8F01DRAFT_1175192 [Mycena amicta]|nr:hypothetical protein C8F01DRAFT_1175192 [Mycena amicta]